MYFDPERLVALIVSDPQQTKIDLLNTVKTVWLYLLIPLFAQRQHSLEQIMAWIDDDVRIKAQDVISKSQKAIDCSELAPDQ